MPNPIRVSHYELLVIARTLWGEARNQGFLGLSAVAWVIRTRLERQIHRYGLTASEVCLKPYQFSCWLPSDPNRPQMERLTLEDSSFRVCYAVAVLVFAGEAENPTPGATHYFNPSVVKPKWAESMEHVALLKDHDFYKEV